MAERNADHVVLVTPDSGGPTLGVRVCRNCGTEAPMPAPPISLSDFAALARAFTVEHRACRPKAPAPNVAELQP